MYLHVDKKIIHRNLKIENILFHYNIENYSREKNILKAKIKIPSKLRKSFNHLNPL